MLTTALFFKYGDKQTMISYRNFKHAINDLHLLGYQAISNLTKFLDKDNSGFVALKDFETAINQTPVSYGRQTSMSSSQGYGRSGTSYAKSGVWSRQGTNH
jgi:hypothetical protein